MALNSPHHEGGRRRIRHFWSIAFVSAVVSVGVSVASHEFLMRRVAPMIHTFSGGSDEAVPSSRKKPTSVLQPLHRTLLGSVSSRPLANARRISVADQDGGTTDRRNEVDEGTRVGDERGSRRKALEFSTEDSSVKAHPNVDSSSLLRCPWWTRIPEKNYPRGGRKGHSSVIYTVRYEPGSYEASRGDYIDVSTDAHLVQASEDDDPQHRKIVDVSNPSPLLSPAMAENITNITDPHTTTNTANNTVISPEPISIHDTVVPSPRPPPVAREYMITSGGFSDNDWSNFKVHALDVAEATLHVNAKWTDLTPPQNDPPQECWKLLKPDDYDTTDDPWSLALRCPPPSRVGHSSVVHDGYLYVFGGLLYDGKDGVFHLEKNGPYVYRLKIANFLPSPDQTQTEPYWERIWARVTLPEYPSDQDTNDKKSKHHHHKNDANEQPGALPYPDDVGNGIDLRQAVDRGEGRGGLWKSQSKLIAYGGLHVRTQSPAETTSSHHRAVQVDTPLGDVWAYDLINHHWEILSSSPPGGKHDENQEKPRPRTAHAATVVGDELIIYGGMSKIGVNAWDGSTKWEELDDVWVFNLVQRQWKTRQVSPSLSRSYHSLVGWENPDRNNGGSIVASFGGYTTVEEPVSDEPVAFVFDDTLVSMPPPANSTAISTWFKAAWPVGMDAETHNSAYSETISNRFEHTAVLSEVWGGMFVWGGRFQFTHQVEGLWVLNIAGPESDVTFVVAQPDGLEEYEATVAALHMLVAAMMFMSMMFTAMCGVLSRHQASDEDQTPGIAEDGNSNPSGLAGVGRRRRGLRQEIIDTLPTKIYRKDSAELGGVEKGDSAQQGDADNDQYMQFSSPQGKNTNPVEECCPICLIDYVDGDEIRTLPCEHGFHTACVDAWLGNNASCPACRYSLRNFASSARRNAAGDGSNRRLSFSSGVIFPRTRLSWRTIIPSSASTDTSQSSEPPPSSPREEGVSVVPIRNSLSLTRFVGSFTDRSLAGVSEDESETGNASGSGNNNRNNNNNASGGRSNNNAARDPNNDDGFAFSDLDHQQPYTSSLELTEEIGARNENVMFHGTAYGNSDEVDTGMMNQRARPMRMSTESTSRERRSGVGRRRGSRMNSNTVPLNDPLQPRTMI